MVGKFFHSFDEETKKVKWQGEVIAELREGYYLVQLFEWLTGQPTIQKIIHLIEMDEWNFYNTNEQMIHYYDSRLSKGLK